MVTSVWFYSINISFCRHHYNRFIMERHRRGNPPWLPSPKSLPNPNNHTPKIITIFRNVMIDHSGIMPHVYRKFARGQARGPAPTDFMITSSKNWGRHRFVVIIITGSSWNGTVGATPRGCPPPNHYQTPITTPPKSLPFSEM